jgi:hypothetical protein
MTFENLRGTRIKRMNPINADLFPEKSSYQYLQETTLRAQRLCEKPLCEKPLYEKPLCEKPLCEKPLYEKPLYEKPQEGTRIKRMYPINADLFLHWNYKKHPFTPGAKISPE